MSNRVSADVTRRMAPPRALIQISRNEGVDVEVPWAPTIERDPLAFDRPTAPAPFWVESLRALEPEPRQTTPSVVKFSSDVRAGRRRLFSALCAALLVSGGFFAARVFATDVVVAQ